MYKRHKSPYRGDKPESAINELMSTARIERIHLALSSIARACFSAKVACISATEAANGNPLAQCNNSIYIVRYASRMKQLERER